MFYYTQAAEYGWPALLGWLSCAALGAGESSSSQTSCSSVQVLAAAYSSLRDGGKAALFGQNPNSSMSSCGSLQSQPAPLAGASPSSLMPPRNCLAPSSEPLCSALRSCQSGAQHCLGCSASITKC